jgi:hypothetical protein
MKFVLSTPEPDDVIKITVEQFQTDVHIKANGVLIAHFDKDRGLLLSDDDDGWDVGLTVENIYRHAQNLIKKGR